MSMTDLNVGIIVRLMDQFSGPGAKLEGSIKRLKTGATDLRRAFGTRIKSGFSEDALAASFERSEGRIRRSRARLLGAFGMAVTLAAPVIVAGNFEEKLIDFANLAEIGQERLARLQDELNALRAPTGQSNVQLLDGLATYVGKGMALDDALASLRATGRTAKATKSQFDQMANSGFAVMDNLGVAPDLLGKAFDVMAKSGKEGSFELAAMARKFPEITAGAKSLKMEGVDAVASLSAALQIAMKSAGSEDQAATNMTNFFGKITAPDTVKRFRKFGVDIEREMQIALARGADPLEHMLLVVKEMTGGDAFKMGELFADKQVLDFLRAMIPNMEEYQRIKKEALGADGVVDADWERVMTGFNEQWRQLRSSTAAMLSTSGSLLPVLTDIMTQVRDGVEWVTAWTSANPELTATIIKGTAALLAFGITTRVLGYGFAIMQGGLLRTASVFLKFDKAGKNVSLVGRSVGFLMRRTRGLSRLMGRGFKWGIKPLRWSKLVRPLVWTSKLIPAIKWGSMAAKIGILGMTAGGWGMLVTPLKWAAKTGLRFIPVIGWALLAADLGMMAWNLVVVPLGWDEFISWDALQSAWDALPTLFMSDKLKAERPEVSKTAGFDALPEGTKSAATELEADYYAARDKGNLPTTEYLDEIPKEQTRLEGEIASLEAMIAKIDAGVGPMKATMISTRQDEINQLKEELAWINEEEVNAQARAAKIKETLGALSDGGVAVDLNSENIDAALAEVRSKASNAAMKVVLDELSSLSQQIGVRSTAPEQSQRPMGRPETSSRPPQRPADYLAPQPNVTVESTFESHPKISVAVTVPVNIIRQQRVDNRAIARATGAEAERATRRALDDAAIAEE